MMDLRRFAALFSARPAVQANGFAADRHRRLAEAEDMDERAEPPDDAVDTLRSLMAEVARRADRWIRLHAAPTNSRFVRWVALPHLAIFAVAWWTAAPDRIAVLTPSRSRSARGLRRLRAGRARRDLWRRTLQLGCLMILDVFRGRCGDGLRQA